MPHRLLTACQPTLAATLLMLSIGAAAQDAASGVYRCGNTYGSTPCPGGRAVAAEDSRTDAQRQQALAVRQQTAQQAKALAAERRARELAATGQQAVRIGPSEADRARAEAAAAKKHGKAKPRKHKSTQTGKPGQA